MVELLLLLVAALLFLGELLERLASSKRLRRLGTALFLIMLLMSILLGFYFLQTQGPAINVVILAALMVSTPFAARLVVRVVNVRHAGTLFMPLKRDGPMILMAIVCVPLGVGMLVAILMANWSRTPPLTLLLGGVAILLIVYPFVMQFDRTEFRENGFLQGEKFITWSEVASCTWNSENKSIIAIDLILKGQTENEVRLSIPLTGRARLNDFLARHIPQPAYAA